MEKMSQEKVLHVAKLAKLEVKEEEIEKYSVQLYDILSEIEKIVKVDIAPELNILISPTFNHDCYRDIDKMPLSKEEVFKNAGSHDDDYIIVPKVIE
ncbi:MAG: Asp-tRNA(Asn)/Glu-tRNA(Gln) amidotransferase subunit GatC [Bacilli bacterium]|nr:Asp-tRNA(Asn)/Glu-tRNA(Gln) amidotransferase subunit GatC [Bacilli bacterium]